jgi:hypothetical protein
MIIISALSLRPLYALPRQDLLGALRLVESSRLPGERIATYGPASLAYLRYYEMPWIVFESAEDLQRIVSRPDRTWVLYRFPREVRYALRTWRG